MPNTSSKTRTRAVRLRNEIADFIDADHNNFRDVIESLYDGVKAGRIYINNGVVTLPNKGKAGHKKVEIPEAIFDSLKATLEMDDMTVGEFLVAVMEAIDEGKIWIEDKKIVVETAQ